MLYYSVSTATTVCVTTLYLPPLQTRFARAASSFSHNRWSDVSWRLINLMSLGRIDFVKQPWLFSSVQWNRVRNKAAELESQLSRTSWALRMGSCVWENRWALNRCLLGTFLHLGINDFKAVSCVACFIFDFLCLLCVFCKALYPRAEKCIHFAEGERPLLPCMLSCECLKK